MKLFLNGLSKILLGFILLVILLFLPAGSFSYWNAWLFLGLLFIPMFIVGILLVFKNPKLLERRLNAKEKQKEQKLIVKLSGLMFIIGFILSGLNFRYSWFQMNPIIVIMASIIFIVSYLFYGEVLRENEYLSRTIEVQENQKVIDTGLYGIIRHPMYSATLFLFLSIPLILGSIEAFIIFLIYPIIIIKRLLEEEKYLEKELNGYKEYQKKVKYRLIPFIY